VNYKRPKRVFVVAYGTEDSVTSEFLIRGSDGIERKPKDYLEAFALFVRRNPAKIAAIEILLDRPQEWSTDALVELRNGLGRAREHFTFESLQKAHETCYNKALVDIISMVKHAAREEAPLLTAAERVDRALERLTAGWRFVREQQQWLDRIRQHLINNLTIGVEDFDAIPIFEYSGGWVRANRVFDGKLKTILEQINAAMAA
jgi:type I restriction enzyme R subunit